mmetsp:Transcript_102292/g.203065  ORF Transcript_102292/g.203065 Transcript_102292/m.203065 type:complete len:94 (+) Transcript_102292:306-587(+)
MFSRMKVQHGQTILERRSPPMTDEPLRVLRPMSYELHERALQFACEHQDKKVVDVIQIHFGPAYRANAVLWVWINNDRCLQNLLHQLSETVKL